MARLKKPLMVVGNCLGDGQPEPAMSRCSGACLIRSKETVEHMRQVGLGDARAVVINREAGLIMLL